MTWNYQRTTKLCKACGRNRPLSEFGTNNKYKDRLQPKCRACMRAAQRRYNNERKIAAAHAGVFVSEAQEQAFNKYGETALVLDVHDPRDLRRKGGKYRMRNPPQAPRAYRNPRIEEQLDGREPDMGYDPDRPLVDDNLPTSWPPSPYRAYPVNVTPVDTDARHQPHNTINTRRSHETPHEPRYPMPASVVRVAGIDFEDDDQGWMPLVDSTPAEAEHTDHGVRHWDRTCPACDKAA